MKLENGLEVIKTRIAREKKSESTMYLDATGYFGDDDYTVDRIVKIDMSYTEEFLYFLAWGEDFNIIKGTNEQKRRVEELILMAKQGMIEEHNYQNDDSIDNIYDFLEMVRDEEYCDFLNDLKEYSCMHDQSIELGVFRIYMIEDGAEMDFEILAESLIEFLEKQIESKQYFI